MYKYLIACLTMLWCSSTYATSRSYYSYQITYDINESVVSSDLGLGAWTGAQIGAAIEAGSISWSNVAGSEVIYKWSGNTTTNSTCTGGQNIVTASSFSCPFGCEPATITFCNNNLNWLIVLNKGYTTNWAVDTWSNSTTADLQAVSAWAFGVGIINGTPSGAVYASGSSCLTQNSPTTANLMRYRSSFCESEVVSMYNSGNGTRNPASFGANDVWIMTSTSYPTPSGSQWSGSSTSIGSFQNEQSGLAEFDFARGLVGGSRQDAFFETMTEKTSPTLPSRAILFNQSTSIVADPPTSLNSSTGSVRRPSIAFDTCRNVWVLMAQVEGSSTSDTFSLWTSSDLSTWTLVNSTLQYSDNSGSRDLISRQPVGLYYDPHWDSIVIAWNNDDPSSPLVSPCTSATPALYQRGCAHELMATAEPAYWVEQYGFLSGATRFRNDANLGLVGYTGTTIACDHTSTSAQFVANFNCVIADSAVEDNHDIWFQNFGYSYNYNADTCFSGSSWSGPALNGAQGDRFFTGRSHWTPSFTVAKNGTADVGLVAVTGGDNRVYLGEATMSQNTAITSSSWGSGWFVPTDPWNTSISLSAPYGAPMVKVDQTGTNLNYMLLLTGVATVHP